jgi:hypothetical protein
MPTLEFKGKPFVYSHHLSVPFRELVIKPKKSLPSGKNASLDDNLIIHGDNLEALKALIDSTNWRNRRALLKRRAADTFDRSCWCALIEQAKISAKKAESWFMPKMHLNI